MKRFVFRFWPLLYILALWFLFSSPYFVKGLVPYPSKYQVTFFPPWSAYEKWWGPVKNNAMPDIIDQIYPWKYLTIDSLKDGEIPYWNPYNFAGSPHLANFQSAVLSPFNLVFFVLPFTDAWSLIVLVQPLLASVFVYLFVRELKISMFGSLVSSVTFMFCGFMTVWMAYGTLSMAAVFLPLALFGIERAFNTGKNWYLLLLTVSLASSFFSGHFQTSLYVGMFAFGYLVFKSFGRYKKNSKSGDLVRNHNKQGILKQVQNDESKKKVVVWAFGFFFLGILISLLQIYPTIIFYLNSVRSEIVYQGGGIPWNYLVTMIAPDFYGNPVTRNDWFGTYAEWASFIGVVPFTLGLFSLYFLKNKYVKFFLFAAAVSSLLAVESPIHNLLVASKIPVIATSIPSRIIILFSFSFAVLAGFGFDTVQEQIKKKSFKKLLAVILAIGGVLLLIWILLVLFTVLPNDKQQTSIAIKNLILPTGLFICTAGMIVLASFVKARYVPIVISIVLLTFVTFDSYRYSVKWMPFDQRELVFPDLPVISAMQKHIGHGRFFGNLGTEVATYYGLSSLEGYDPLYIQRYGEFIRYANEGVFREAERSVVRVDRRGKYTDRVLDLLGVSLIYHPLADTNQNWAYPVWEKDQYAILYQDDKFQLYKNNEAMPRVSLFYNYEIIPDKKEILKRFYSEAFDFRRSIILEETPTTAVTSGSGIQERKILEYTPNKVKIWVKSSDPALLFLSDTHYPKWHATVNGEETKILRANYAFRAVEVPAGESEVVFYYKEY